MPSSSPEAPFEEKLRKCWPPDQWAHFTLVLAVSGGPDSMALLRAMHALHVGAGRGGSIFVGHFNHALRGADSDADEQFVRAECEKLGVVCLIGHRAATPFPGAGLEAAAREDRYAFLRTRAEEVGARHVLTGHTADDQAETILHHLLRGTGLSGLAGIPRARPLGQALSLVRPLLELTRADVIEYLDQLGQTYCQDASNLDPRMTRNRIRHELLPLIQREYSPGVVESLVRLGSLAGDAQRVIAGLAEELLAGSLVEVSARGATLDCRALASVDRHLIREAFVALWRRQDWPLQSMGFIQWNRLADMVLESRPVEQAASQTTTLPGAVAAQRKGEQLWLLAGE